MSIQKPRPTGVNLKPEQREQIIALYEAGESTASIAKQFNVNKSTVSRITLKAGLREPLESAGKRLDQATIKEIKQMFTMSNLSKQKIADKLGISYDAVHHHTQGLSRSIPDYKRATIAEMYLSGELSAEYLREHEGITKKLLYSFVREFLGLQEDDEFGKANK